MKDQRCYKTMDHFIEPKYPKPGDVVIANNIQTSWPGEFIVFIEGDGTLEGDTRVLGLFWREEDARLFFTARRALEGK